MVGLFKNKSTKVLEVGLTPSVRNQTSSIDMLIDDMVNSLKHFRDDYVVDKLENAWLYADTSDYPYLIRYSYDPLTQDENKEILTFPKDSFEDPWFFKNMLDYEKYNIVHLQTIPTNTLFEAINDHRLEKGTPLVYTAHSLVFWDLVNSQNIKLEKDPRKLNSSELRMLKDDVMSKYQIDSLEMQEQIMDIADEILVPSEFMRGLMRKLYPQYNYKTEVFPLTSDLEGIVRKRENGSSITFDGVVNISRNFDFNLEKDFAIGYIGRVIEDKGIDELVDAFKMLVDHNYPVRLYLVGPYDENYGDHIREKLRGYEKKYLLMDPDKDPIFANSLGFSMDELKNNPYKKRLALASYYDFLNLFVMPTHYESASRSTLESLLFRTPALVSNIDGPRDLFVSKGYARPIEDPYNPFEIASKMANMINNYKEEKTNAGRAAKELLEKYSLRNAGAFYNRLFKRLKR